MRIKQLAELTGTTVRSVRYYHKVGLLNTPEECDGWRDYTMKHVARVSRIRWLASAGLSLSAIETILDASPQGTTEDLRSTLIQIDNEIARLNEQRRRLASLLGAATQGRTLSPMPKMVAEHYAAMEERATDERTLRAIRAERDFVELAWYRGEMPPVAELLFNPMGSAEAAVALASYGRDLEELDDVGIEQAAAAVVEHMLDTLGEQADAAAQGLTAEDVDRIYDLYGNTSSPGNRRLGEAVRRRLQTALSERKTVR